MPSFREIRELLLRLTLGVAALLVAAALVLTMLWRDRGLLDDIDVPHAPMAYEIESPVTLTWFGVSTLLFDDGETQILIDGFISRPSLFEIVANRPVDNDAAKINYFLNEYRVRRLAALIPVHSHFDHAMDVGAIGNRTSASILGSASTAEIARGAGVPEDQIVVVEDGAEYSFGLFTVRLIESNHAPVGLRGSVPFPGEIVEPLELPAPVSAMREGTSYSIVVAHPAGTTLVQGSGGLKQSALAAVEADVVMLGTGMIEGLGRDYLAQYWQETVTSTGAETVIPVHFDDFAKPFGEIVLSPRFLDNFADTMILFEEFRQSWDVEASIYLPVFGEAMALFPPSDPET
jgi:L-ascorbate metabolism protein UlaG (beta-lactamase superfamily)